MNMGPGRSFIVEHQVWRSEWALGVESMSDTGHLSRLAQIHLALYQLRLFRRTRLKSAPSRRATGKLPLPEWLHPPESSGASGGRGLASPSKTIAAEAVTAP